MLERFSKLAALTLSICSLAALPACDFLGTGDGNNNSNNNGNTNSNNNGNSNSNGNTNGNANSNTNGNDNDNTNTNTNTNNNNNDNENENTNTNDNDNDNDNSNTNTNDNDNDNTNGNGNDNTDDEFAVFTDPETGFTTTVVYDSNRDTAQFRVSDDSIVIDGIGYQPGSWEVNGNFLDAAQSMEAQFGTEVGVRRAFFTLTGEDTVCDFFIEDGQFVMTPSNEPIPNDE